MKRLVAFIVLGALSVGCSISALCSDARQRYVRIPRFPKSEQETAEGNEEVREGATESRAQNAEDGTKEHEISVAAVLIQRRRSPYCLQVLQGVFRFR